MGVAILGVVAAFIVPPLLATDYGVRQGAFEARILSSASGMGMAGRPIVRARVEDQTGRIFWIGMPTTAAIAPETRLAINVWCETGTFETCIARYGGAID